MTKKPIPSIHVPIMTDNGSMELAWYLYLKSTGEGGGSSTIVDWDDITNKPEFATVATSGSYNDLSNKPTIPIVNNSTITFTQGGVTKGTITLNQSSSETIAFESGGGTGLPDQTGHSGDFLTTNGTSASWGAAPVTSVNSKTGAVTLTASDVGALPDSTVIPAAQVNSDWNASSGVAEILNKPTLGTMAAESANDYTKTSGLAAVATSGSYSDLDNKPTIPIVNNSTITFTQGGVTKGTITTNQSSASTIALDAGGAVALQSIGAIMHVFGSNPAINGSIVSGFGNSSYLELPGVFKLGASDTGSFEINCAFITQATEDTNKKVILVGYAAGQTFGANGGGVTIRYGAYVGQKIEVLINGANSTQTITGTTDLLPATKYYVKIEYDGTNYKLWLSTDGFAYTLEISDARTVLPAPATFYIGRDFYHIESVDMSGWNISKNRQMIWAGMDAPGLHQKANIDLSNIPTNIDYVVESQLPTAQNNYTWYRKYKSGWVEQGGRADVQSVPATTSQNISLPVTMVDNKYAINLQEYTNSTNISNENANYIYSQTTTGFEWRHAAYGGNTQTMGVIWQVSGTAA